MIHTRFASEEDAETLAAIRVETWNAAYRGVIADDLLDDLRVDEAHVQQWRDAVAGGFTAGRMAWIAERGGVPLGYALAGPPRDEAPARAGELYAIYVLPDEWGNGVGTALLTAVTSYLRSEAYVTAVLWVFDANARARRFYQMHGWRTDGERRMSQRWRAPELRYARAL